MTTAISVVIAVFATLAVTLGVWILLRSRSLSKLRSQSATKPAATVAEGRIALDARNFRKIIRLTNGFGSTDPDANEFIGCILRGAALEGVGAGGAAADLMIGVLQRPPPDDAVVLTDRERSLLHQWIDRFPTVDVSAWIKELPPPDQPVELEGARQALDVLKASVGRQVQDAKIDARSSGRLNLWLGTGAAAVAAGVGVATGSTTLHGNAKLILVIPALFSAALSTFLTTLRPADRERLAQERASALQDLDMQIDLYLRTPVKKAEPTQDSAVLTEAYDRLAMANGHARPTPLTERLAAPSKGERQSAQRRSRATTRGKPSAAPL